jgi:hypothetical protein
MQLQQKAPSGGATTQRLTQPTAVRRAIAPTAAITKPRGRTGNSPNKRTMPTVTNVCSLPLTGCDGSAPQ